MYIYLYTHIHRDQKRLPSPVLAAAAAAPVSPPPQRPPRAGPRAPPGAGRSRASRSGPGAPKKRSNCSCLVLLHIQYVYKYIYIYTPVCMYVCMYAYIYVYACMSMYVHIPAGTYACTGMQVHIHMHTIMDMYLINYPHARICICIRGARCSMYMREYAETKHAHPDVMDPCKGRVEWSCCFLCQVACLASEALSPSAGERRIAVLLTATSRKNDSAPTFVSAVARNPQCFATSTETKKSMPYTVQ